MSGTLASLRGFGAFWWDFIVGDDRLPAAGVIVGLVATAGLAHAGAPAWWAAPVIALAALGASLLRHLTARRRDRA